MTFNELELQAPLLRALADAGYSAPTPIQAQAIPALLQGRDLCGLAQTGTGKTAAFALPILQRLAAAQRPGIRALVLAPTRELAAQIDASFRDYGKYLRLRSTVIFGGVGQAAQVRAIGQGVQILVATPGRLLDLAHQGHLRFDALEVLVLDEADRMLDMGFLPDLRRVLRLLPPKRQTLLFSATMPREIEHLVAELLHDPVRVAITPEKPTAQRIAQTVHFVERTGKRALLASLLANPEIESAIVFTRTKHGANRVVTELGAARITAEAIHGNKSQNARERALANFKSGRTRVLVATDIAARGIDVDGISHVINYDLPAEAETYVHRIGRTARAGASGEAISLCDPEERKLLRDIERLIRTPIPVAAGGRPPAR